MNESLQGYMKDNRKSEHKHRADAGAYLIIIKTIGFAGNYASSDQLTNILTSGDHQRLSRTLFHVSPSGVLSFQLLRTMAHSFREPSFSMISRILPHFHD